ncbi:MAG: hypothetical protein JW810_11945 [Sedimentisphaerales bacterium]|nr:hypothetical protein [Sedimentisphaerales bacterium]
MMDEMQPNKEPFQSNPDVEEHSWEEVTDSELAAAEAAEQSYSLPKDHKRFNRSAMIFMASCLIGVGTIYLFSLRQKPKQASAQQVEMEAKVDQALAKLVDQNQQKKSRELFEDTEEMVQAFYEYPTKQQVKLQELQRDPFSRLWAREEAAVSVDDAAERQEKLRQELTRKAEAMKLQSILLGPNTSRCLIDGQIYCEGDTVLSTFTIKSITQDQVILLSQEMEFRLQM